MAVVNIAGEIIKISYSRFRNKKGILFHLNWKERTFGVVVVFLNRESPGQRVVSILSHDHP